MKTRIQSIIIAITFLFPGLLIQLQAISPAPDGCYPNITTAEGCNALSLLTTGAANTGLGWRSLFSDSTGSFNTGVGAGTLVLNNADSNTAVGTAALLLNTAGTNNTAVGTAALVHNDTGNFNTAHGAFALSTNTIGFQNTANGALALQSNTGSDNTANGALALISNTTGGDNTANGAQALDSNTTGSENTAVGVNALVNNISGNNNIALGFQAGAQQTTGSDNIYIGFNVQGTVGESNACYIKSIFGQTAGGGSAVFIDSNHKLGTLTSSKRFKEEIKPMDKASDAVLRLKPVTFRYKKEIDPAGISQFGLVAEEVEKVNPDLVVRDNDGKPYSVRYDQVNAMLLNEFLKEHKKVEEQQATIVELKSEMSALAATVQEQASELRQVKTQIPIKDSPSVIVSNH